MNGYDAALRDRGAVNRFFRSRRFPFPPIEAITAEESNAEARSVWVAMLGLWHPTERKLAVRERRYQRWLAWKAAQPRARRRRADAIQSSERRDLAAQPCGRADAALEQLDRDLTARGR